MIKVKKIYRYLDFTLTHSSFGQEYFEECEERHDDYTDKREFFILRRIHRLASRDKARGHSEEWSITLPLKGKRGLEETTFRIPETKVAKAKFNAAIKKARKFFEAALV